MSNGNGDNGDGRNVPRKYESYKIGKEKISREKGYLYFVGKDGYVWAAPMKSNPSGKKKKVGKEKISKESGYMYFIGKDGYVSKANMKKSDD